MSAQKIDGNKLKTYKMIIASFQMDDKDKKSCFLEKTFLLAEISINVVFEMSFFILRNIVVKFNNHEL